MKILHLIGNGFDVNLGLKTKYTDFYEQYVKEDSNTETLAFLKADIINYLKQKEVLRPERGYVKWSDLEITLGEITTEFESAESFISFYSDINLSLRKYIKEQEATLEGKDIAKLKKDLIMPARSPYLRQRDYDILKYQFFDRWKSSSWSVNVVTFNYTSTIERILRTSSSPQCNIGNNNYNVSTSLQFIKHIHGIVDEYTLVGLNDISQIKNKAFRENKLITNLLVKPHSNDSIGSTIDLQCKKMVENANLICLFGLSLGDSDLLWWEHIGEQLKRTDCRLIYFVRSEPLVFPQLLENRIIEWKNTFLSKTKLSENEKKEVEDKIFVGYNTDIFKL